MNRSTQATRLLAAAVLLSCCIFAMPALAADEAGTAPDTATTPTFRHATMWNGPLVLAPPTQAGEGMRAVIDAKTGELRAATPGELRVAQLLSASRATNGLQRTAAASETHRADGSVSAVVPEELMSYAVVQIGADGQASFACVDGDSHDHVHAAAAPEVE